MTSVPQGPMGTVPVAPQGNGLATAGMVLGIVSAALCWMFCAPYIPIIVGVVGLVLSILGLSKAKQLSGAGAGKAKVGLILSIIGIVVPLIIIVVGLLFFKAVVGTGLRKAIEMYTNTR